MSFIEHLKERIALRKFSEQEIFHFLRESFIVNGELLYVGKLLKNAAEKYGDDEALIGQDRTLNYKEFYFRSVLLSEHLKKQGVKPRDRVLLYCENSLEFYLFYFAIWQIGAVVAPINLFLHERELAHVINDAQPAAICTTTKLAQNLENLVKSGAVAHLPAVLTQETINWNLPTPALFKNIHPNFRVIALKPDEMCLLLYTSGTTGVPKGVMLSSRNVLTNSLQAYARLKTISPERERFFAVLPLFHVFAQNSCLWLPVMSGSSVIVVSRIDRSLILEGLKKKPTLFFGFPALYGLLCLMRNAPLDSVKLFVSGADALPDKIRAAFGMIYGRKICSGYGLTEASPVVAINQVNQEAATNFVGHPMVGLECDIRDENEKSLAQGQVGSLWIKGDNIMLGYYNASEATAKILKNGWLNTGDLAQLDEQGNIVIQGRLKDLIIHKGFNIYPQEVENVLLMHPAVFKAAVIGKDEVASGQVPVAFVAVKVKDADMEEILRQFCSANLASYKIPRKIICVDDLPMNAAGKVDKKQLSNL